LLRKAAKEQLAQANAALEEAKEAAKEARKRMKQANNGRAPAAPAQEG
jgi:hypothetical protein